MIPREPTKNTDVIYDVNRRETDAKNGWSSYDARNAFTLRHTLRDGPQTRSVLARLKQRVAASSNLGPDYIEGGCRRETDRYDFFRQHPALRPPTLRLCMTKRAGISARELTIVLPQY